MHSFIIEQDKEEKKIERADEKRAAKEKRKSQKLEGATSPVIAAREPTPTDTEETPAPAPAPASPVLPTTPVEVAKEEHATIAERRESTGPAPIRTSMEDQSSVRMQEIADAANTDEVTPMSPSSPKDKGKVKNWLKTKFARRASKSQKSPTEKEKEKETSTADKGFIGGAALTGTTADNTGSLGANDSSAHDDATVVTASKDTESQSPVISPVDSVPDTDRNSVSEEELEDRGRRTSKFSDVSRDDDDEFQEARDNFDEDLAPPPTFVAEKGTSPVRAGRFTEDI